MRSTALPSREYAAIRTLRVRADAPISVVIGHRAGVSPKRSVVSVAQAVADAEAEALRLHEAGECHLSEWSCSHCEAAAERMGGRGDQVTRVPLRAR